MTSPSLHAVDVAGFRSGSSHAGGEPALHRVWSGSRRIRTALDLELAEGTVVADRVGETDCIFLAGLYRAEQTIAERLLTLAKGKLPWGSINPDNERACMSPQPLLL